MAAGALTLGLVIAGSAIVASHARASRGGSAATLETSISASPTARAGVPRPALIAPIATTAKPRPVVYVQAGHQPPGEPGYLAQTGASGGPFGSEEAFNVRLANALQAKLHAAGIVVYHTPARVTPWAATGAVFISLHFDSVGGSAGIGYAVDQPGRGENYYQGEGFGAASPVPYRNSAPHRRATKVTLAVQQHSLKLASDLATTFRPIFTRANGARSHFRGVEPGAQGNARMQFFYGYYRVNTGARVLIECGASGADNAFLAHINLLATSISKGIINYLHQTGQLG